MLNIYSQYLIKFEIRVKDIFDIFWAIVNLDFILLLYEILYKSEIMNEISYAETFREELLLRYLSILNVSSYLNF